jgi:hypothetical protein
VVKITALHCRVTIGDLRDATDVSDPANAQQSLDRMNPCLDIFTNLDLAPKAS